MALVSVVGPLWGHMTDPCVALKIERLLGSLPLSMVALDMRGHVLAWNRRAETMYGWLAEEVLGKSVEDLGIAVDASVDAAKVMAQLRGGQPWEGEYRMRHRDGREFTVHVVDSPLFNAAGAVTGFIGIAIDASAQRQAPIAVLNAVIGNSPTSVTVVGADNRIVLTLGDERTSYEAKSSYVGKALADLLPASAVPDVMSDVRNGAGPVRYEVQYGDRTYDTTAVALPDSVAGIGGVACVAIDVTERVAEARRFRALVENLQEVTSIVNADGSLRYISPTVEQLSGYTSQEVMGACGWDFVHPDDLAATQATLQAVLEQPNVLITQTFRRRHRDGQWLDVEQSMINRLDDPSVQGLVAVARDVTDRDRGSDNYSR